MKPPTSPADVAHAALCEAGRHDLAEFVCWMPNHLDGRDYLEHLDPPDPWQRDDLATWRRAEAVASQFAGLDMAEQSEMCLTCELTIHHAWHATPPNVADTVRAVSARCRRVSLADVLTGRDDCGVVR